MKKLFYSIVVAIFSLSVCGCAVKPDYMQYVSQIRRACFFGESSSFRVTAYSEEREYPLKADGYPGEMTPFVIIKLNFIGEQNMLITGLSADFVIDKKYTAELPFRAESDGYVASVMVDKLPEGQLTVTITYDGVSENVELTQTGKKNFSPEQALDVAVIHKNQLIGGLIDNNDDFEICIRVMYESDNLYYYVGIVEHEYTTALLISEDGSVLAEKRLKNQ